MTRASSTDDVQIAVHDLGGSGPDVLMAHATGFHGMVWAPLAEELGESFHLHSFDERGHGDSSPPASGDFAWQGFADDALATIDELGLDRPFGIGHSAGAVALLLAEVRRPGTFRALFCYEPVIFPFDDLPPRPPGDHPLATGARRRRDVFESRQAALENYRSKPPLSVLRADALDAYVRHGFEDLDDGTVRLKCRPENEARTYEMGMQHGAYGLLSEIDCPVTLAGGEHADTFTPEIIRQQAEPLRHGRVEILEGLGHFGPLQDPAAVAAAVRRAFTAA